MFDPQKRIALLAVMILTAQLLLPLTAAADDQGVAQSFVQLAVKEMATIVDAVRAGTPGQDKAIRVLLARRFDMKRMAMAALPKPFVQGQESSVMSRYMIAYESYLVKSLLRQSEHGPVYQTTVIGSKLQSEGGVIVSTKSLSPKGARRSGDWFVELWPEPRIVDAAVDGIRISADQRKDFRPILQRGGMEALIAALKVGPSAFSGPDGTRK